MKQAVHFKEYATKVAAALNTFETVHFTLDELKDYLKKVNQFNSFVNIVVETLISKVLIAEVPDIRVGRVKYYQFTTHEPISYAMFTLEIKKEQADKKKYNQSHRKPGEPESVAAVCDKLVKLDVPKKKLKDNHALIKAIQMCESHGCPVMIPASLLF